MSDKRAAAIEAMLDQWYGPTYWRQFEVIWDKPREARDAMSRALDAALAVLGKAEPIARTAADGSGSAGKTPGVAVLAGGGDRQSDVYYRDAWVKRLEARIAVLEASVNFLLPDKADDI